MLLTLFLAGCGGSSEPQEPPPETTPVSEVEITQEILNTISIRIDEIRLAEGVDRELLIDNIWMIPLDPATLEGMNARFQYVTDGEAITLNSRVPYRPDTPFMLGVDKDELGGEDFGIWFMVTSFGSDGEALRRQFEDLIQEAVPFLGMAALTAALTAITPGVPEEISAIPATVTRGIGIMGRISALGGGLLRTLERGMQSETTQMAAETVEQLAESLSSAASAVASRSAYFGEAYVTFSAVDNYRLNHRISVVTTDGSLVIVFSVIETTNAPQPDLLPTPEFESMTLAVDECNPQQQHGITSGMKARILPMRHNAYVSPIDSTSPIAFTLRQGEEVTLSLPYCDVASQTLWWQYCKQENVCGWIAENQGDRRFLEPVQ